MSGYLCLSSYVKVKSGQLSIDTLVYFVNFPGYPGRHSVAVPTTCPLSLDSSLVLHCLDVTWSIRPLSCGWAFWSCYVVITNSAAMKKLEQERMLLTSDYTMWCVENLDLVAGV